MVTAPFRSEELVHGNNICKKKDVSLPRESNPETKLTSAGVVFLFSKIGRELNN